MSEPDRLRCETIQVRSRGIFVAVASQRRTHVLSRDPQNIRPIVLGIRLGGDREAEQSQQDWGHKVLHGSIP